MVTTSVERLSTLTDLPYDQSAFRPVLHYNSLFTGKSLRSTPLFHRRINTSNPPNKPRQTNRKTSHNPPTINTPLVGEGTYIQHTKGHKFLHLVVSQLLG